MVVSIIKNIQIKTVLLVLLIVTLILNIILLSVIFNPKPAPSINYPLLSLNTTSYNQNDLIIRFMDLRNMLRQKYLPYGDNFSLYFEYLPTGVSITINEKKEFSPASLIKVPLAIAYYNHLEDDHITKDSVVAVSQEDLDPLYGSLWKKGAGYQLPLSQVVKIMLVESDNTAMKVLSRYVPSQAYEDLYNGLDLSFEDGNKFIVTAKSYVSILKSLYYSSILSKKDSQLILNYLAHATDRDFLPSGLPDNVTVAHKIGINQKENIYQDCGVIYLPRRPYALCVIVHSDKETARNTISEVSRTIYNYVSMAIPPPNPDETNR